MGFKKNVLGLLEDRTNKYSDRVALGIKNQLGWREFTYKGLSLLSRKLACYLMDEVGVQKGEKLAIISESKPEFGVAVFASILSGLTTVPLDVKLTKYELYNILSDCKPSVMLVSMKNVTKALELQKEIPSIREILVMDEPPCTSGLKSIYELPNNYEHKWVLRSSKETAFIIYTSGTTGAPKGIETTFANMMAQLDDISDVLNDILPQRPVNVLSILPMNHLFEMTVGFSTFMNFGFSIYYTQSLKPKDVLSIMREKRVEYMIVVPAFLKLLKSAIESDIASNPKPIRTAFKIMHSIAKYIPFVSVKKLLFKRIHAKFGGCFLGFFSGGAPLDISVGEFFNRIGIKVYQVYGLSEVSPVASINTNSNELSSVGPILKSFDAKIDEQTGELLLKGPAVMKGYHNQPELTAAAFTPDGWLHTGDIGEIHRNGHLYITGRIKNLIVLSGGKKVFPEEVEAVLEKSQYFSEVCVLGISRTFGAKDGTEEIAAVIVPTDEILNKYDDETVEKLVRDEVKKLSEQLTQYKRPVNIVVTRTPLPRTGTKKVKRREVKELVSA